MRYIVDTDLLIDINKGNPKVLTEITKKFEDLGEGLYTTFLNFIEYYFGELGKGKEKEALNFLDSFKHLTLTKNSSVMYAKLNKKYLRLGKTISAFDLLIAAIAIENNMTVLTRDSDFERITELKKEIISGVD